MPIIKETTETKISIEPDILEQIEEEAQVVIHCSFYNDPTLFEGDMALRVWQETFIIDEQSGAMCQMVKAFGIVYQPLWEFIKPGRTKRFTMVFDALPKSCKSFTLAEIINQPGPFIVKGIKRNNSDIYSVRLD
jgi:hypothetical protein